MPIQTVASSFEKKHYALFLRGEIRFNKAPAIEKAIEEMKNAETVQTVMVDANALDFLDSTALGELAKFAIAAKEKTGTVPALQLPSKDLKRIMTNLSFNKLFAFEDRINGEVRLPSSAHQLSEAGCSEQSLRQAVLSAHQVLSDLSEENRKKFSDVIKTFKDEKK